MANNTRHLTAEDQRARRNNTLNSYASLKQSNGFVSGDMLSKRQRFEETERENLNQRLSTLNDLYSKYATEVGNRTKLQGYQSDAGAFHDESQQRSSEIRSHLMALNKLKAEYGDVVDLSSLDNAIKGYNEGVHSLNTYTANNKDYWSNWSDATSYGNYLRDKANRDKYDAMSIDELKNDRKTNSKNKYLTSDGNEATPVSAPQAPTNVGGGRGKDYNPEDNFDKENLDIAYIDSQGNAKRYSQMIFEKEGKQMYEAIKGNPKLNALYASLDNAPASTFSNGSGGRGKDEAGLESSGYAMQNYNNVKDYLAKEGIDLEKVNAYLQAEQDKKNNDYLTEKAKELAQNAPLLANAMYIASALPVALFEGTDILLNKGNSGSIDDDSYIPYQTQGYHLSNMANAMVSQRAEDLTQKFGGGTFGQFIGNTYQGAMSGLQSYALVTASASLGAFAPAFVSGIMSLQAGTQSWIDGIDRGLAPKTAYNLAIANGLNEYIGEKVSLDEFVKPLDPKTTTFGKKVATFFKQAGVEASEEVFTDIINTVADNYLAGQLSSMNLKYEQYLAEGYSKYDAKLKTGLDFGTDLLNSAWGGFVGGAIGGAIKDGRVTGYQILDNIRTGNSLSESERQALVSAGMNSDNASISSLASKLNANGNKGDYSMGKLANKLNENYSDKLTTPINYALQQAVKSSLEAKKINISDPQLVSATRIVDKLQNGTELSKSEKKFANKYQLEDISKSLNTEEAKDIIETNAVTNMVKASNEVKTINNEMYKAKHVSNDGKTYAVINGKSEEVQLTSVNSISKDEGIVFNTKSGITVSMDDVAFASDDELNLYSAIKAQGIKDANTANMIVNSYKANDSLTPSEFVTAFKTGITYGVANANVEKVASEGLFGKLNASTQAEAMKIGASMKQTYSADMTSRGFSKMAQGEFDKTTYVTSNMLSPKQKSNITYAELANKYLLNSNIVMFESNGKYLDNAELGAYLGLEKDEATGRYLAPNGAYKDGKIFLDVNAGGDGKNTIMYTLSHELVHEWSERDHESYEAFEKVFVNGLKDGKTLESLISKYTARGLNANEALEEVLAEAMQEMLTDSDVVNRMLEIKKQDKNLWQKIVDFLAKMLKKIQNLYSKETLASEEVEAFKSMSEDIQSILKQMYAEGVTGHSSTQQELSTMLSEAEKGTLEAGEFRTDVLQQNADGLVGIDNPAKTQIKTETEPLPKFIMSLTGGEAKLVDVKSLKGYKGESKKVAGLTEGQEVDGFTGRAIREYVMGLNGFSDKNIENVNKFMDSMKDLMEEAGVTFTFIGIEDVNNAEISYTYDGKGKIKSAVLSAMIKNGDYPINFDLTAICKKREAMSRFLDKIAKSGAVDNGTVKLTEDVIWDLNRTLKDAGYETACLGCFVESKRYNISEWANSFVNKWNEAVLKVNKDATYFGFGTSDSKYRMTLKEAENLEEAVKKYGETTLRERKDIDIKAMKKAVKDGTFKFGELNQTAQKKLAKSKAFTEKEKTDFLARKGEDAFTYKEAVRLLEENIVSPSASLSNTQNVEHMVNSGEEYQHLLRVSDLTTARGMEALQSLPNFYGILYGNYGSGTPKPIQAFTPYNSEIALLPNEKGSKENKQSLADYLYTIAGVRMQSFSDFQIQNVYDYLQMIADLSAKKLPAHAYSKEISFARLFGMTGLKINMSVMFDVDTSVGGSYAGLTKLDPNVHKGEYAKVVLEDENGKWVYNIGDYATQQAYKNAYPDRPLRFLQSIGFADAVKLQQTEGYSKNCGIIAVGYSDKAIFAMLDDNRIRYIIPYHSSSLPAFIKVETNIEYAKDYQSLQNNMKISSLLDTNGDNAKYVTKSGKEVKWSIANVAKDVGYKEAINMLNDHIKNDGWKITTKKSENGHGSFDLYEDLGITHDARATANNYLAWCAKNDTIPLFYAFAGHDNYYKLLFDFNMYDSITEEYAPQGEVTTTYPMKDSKGNLVASNIIDGKFKDAYLKETITKQMNFQNEQFRNFDSDMESLAESVATNRRNANGTFTIARQQAKDSEGNKSDIRYQSKEGDDYTELINSLYNDDVFTKEFDPKYKDLIVNNNKEQLAFFLEKQYYDSFVNTIIEHTKFTEDEVWEKIADITFDKDGIGTVDGKHM